MVRGVTDRAVCFRKGVYMEEKVYKTMKATGISNLIIGILLIVFGVTSGVAVIVNGAKLLRGKKDLMF